jgi:hypothetical protein
MALKSKLQVVLDKLTNYSHTVIGTVYALAVAAYHFKTGRDLGSGFVTFSGYFYMFLLGHATAYQKWPDQSSTDLGTASSSSEPWSPSSLPKQ